MLVLLQGVLEEDQGFVMQQSIGTMTTTEQRYSHLNTTIILIPLKRHRSDGQRGMKELC